MKNYYVRINKASGHVSHFEGLCKETAVDYINSFSKIYSKKEVEFGLVQKTSYDKIENVLEL
jgi:hypothetical protein